VTDCDPRSLRVNLNELPYPPPARVLRAAAEALKSSNLYPEGRDVLVLKELMAKYTGVGPENVHFASGSDYAFYELFSQLRVFSSGPLALIIDPTFSSYEPILKATGWKVERVKLIEGEERWNLPPDGLKDALKHLKPSLLVVDDPNNPTGSPIFGGESIEGLAGSLDEWGGWLLIDEAYAEFSGYSISKLVGSIGNLVVFRTLSKAFALAGLRSSALLAAERLIASIESGSPRFELSRPTLAASVEALRDPSYALRYAREIVNERQRMWERLAGIQYLKSYKSWTNFFLLKFTDEDALRRTGINFMRPAMRGSFVRFSLMDREADDCLLVALEESLRSRIK